MKFAESSESEQEPNVFENYGGITVRLPLEHSLWAHVLFNASKVCVDLIQSGEIDIMHKSVLELGAGSGICSFASIRSGAAHVSLNEYPDQELIDNLHFNVNNILTEEQKTKLKVTPFVWGRSTLERKFDVILLCDVIQVVPAHSDIISELIRNLERKGIVYFLYQHHEPKKIEKVNNFAEKMKEHFEVERIKTVHTGVQFKEDKFGFDAEREVVHVFKGTWKN
ncbi:Nicotinamide_N-methyltransferase [Hexamita inflata]|uniref:Nicotinamide N-methyltransferase n=1 Tax=Hexamita inflata TaxID=28002 RepID=A0AA86N661_9EUKA|nr:Nicotinamide N-methyltransferase [Hexamita inflata]